MTIQPFISNAITDIYKSDFIIEPGIRETNFLAAIEIRDEIKAYNIEYFSVIDQEPPPNPVPRYYRPLTKRRIIENTIHTAYKTFDLFLPRNVDVRNVIIFNVMAGSVPFAELKTMMQEIFMIRQIDAGYHIEEAWAYIGDDPETGKPEYCWFT